MRIRQPADLCQPRRWSIAEEFERTPSSQKPLQRGCARIAEVISELPLVPTS